MTVRDWVDARVPAPPPALGDRIAEALGEHTLNASASPYDACLDAALRLLGDLLVPEALGRESAPDLLAADALVTYAFEAAADDLARIEDRSSTAMLHLAALAQGAE
jgi:hypothetical protein